MKTISIKIAMMIVWAVLLVACSTQKGSANDTTGTNGATNGNGKVAKSDKVHNYNN